ncbi:hypothetical protein LPJ53_001642 [Coemansia erecta]|uniref:Uncharacterized protein n=1 Tax=Coemansia erecta TaxID=147472 RepID=A0A9W7Y4I0_9FUNG|nr:hypothetical protein LPJ53_001642 [Coemansia erecta]
MRLFSSQARHEMNKQTIKLGTFEIMVIVSESYFESLRVGKRVQSQNNTIRSN